MDKSSLVKHTHIADFRLSLKDKDYKQWVFRYTFLELEKDLGQFGDITTNVLFSPTDKAEGVIVAKEGGVVAGLDELQYFLVDADREFAPRLKGEIKFEARFKDGDEVKAGDEVARVSGYVSDLMAVERVVLNLLMRMSGVATFTKKMVALAGDDVLIAPTRKTLWGLLDKRAVLLGGGGTHRLNLSDAVIVKDTHLDLKKRNFSDVLSRLCSVDTKFVEVEVEDGDEASVVANFFAEHKCDSVPVIMFDNMRPRDIENAISYIGDVEILFEASGSINETNVKEFANTGVDIISMGCLTSAKMLDFSFKIL